MDELMAQIEQIQSDKAILAANIGIECQQDAKENETVNDIAQKRGRGRPRKFEQSTQVQVKFPPEMIAGIDRLAKKSFCTRSAVIRALVLTALNLKGSFARAEPVRNPDKFTGNFSEIPNSSCPPTCRKFRQLHIGAKP